MGIISAKLIKRPYVYDPYTGKEIHRYCYFCPGYMALTPIIRVFGKWPEGDTYTIYAHYKCAQKHWANEPKVKEALK